MRLGCARFLPVCIAVAALASGPAMAQDAPASPGPSRHVGVVRVAEPPLIDGRVDDEVWARAALAQRFWEVAQGREAVEPTEVRVLATDDTLYFAFRAFDSRPEEIEARQQHRDAGLEFDDQVSVELDPFHNHRDISTFTVNAIGTQEDDIAGGRARKTGWKGDWRAAAARTKDGWTAEIAIPFAMLNYDDGARAFGVNFSRYHHRTKQQSFWSDVTPQLKPELMGVLDGLDPPTADTHKWTFMPYVVAGTNTPDKTGEIRERMATGGMDLRWQPRRNQTGVLSLAPDFSQLEAQFATVNFSYTEKLVADPRPFFREGERYFQAGRDFLYFYSNRVPDFDAGAKWFGRTNGTQYGAFATQAPDGRQDFATRILREFGGTHAASVAVYTSRRPETTNDVLVAQAGGRTAGGFVYAADLASSRTGAGQGDGAHGRAEAGLDTDFWKLRTSLDRYARDFLPLNGLLPADLPGTQGGSASAEYYRVHAGTVHAVGANLALTERRAADGTLQRRYLDGNGYVELANQVLLGLGYKHRRYRPVTETPGAFETRLNDDSYANLDLQFNTRSATLGYGFAWSQGRQDGASYRFVPAFLWARPAPGLFLSLSAERLDNRGRSTQAILVAKWDITNSDALGVRLAASDGQRYYRLSYGREVRKGMDVFGVVDRQPGLGTQISVKLLYALSQ
jgi:hypothetical protein